MDRKIMIKILELLEEAYPKPCVAETLMKKVGLHEIDGEFYQIIRYLRETHKIIIVLIPESRMDSKPTREKLQKVDEITINSDGIDFLDKMKGLEIDKSRNYLLLDTTIVLTQIAIIGILLTLVDKFNLLSNPSIKIPWLLSAIMWVVLLTFTLLLFYKIINIIFSKESWKGILFSRD